MSGYITGLIGCWLLGDAIWSILYYPKESWARNHIFRIIRGLLALVLITIGGIMV